MLSNLKDVLRGENGRTRLELARRKVDSEFKQCENAAPDGEVCYIRLHERGREAQRANAFFGF